MSLCIHLSCHNVLASIKRLAFYFFHCIFLLMLRLCVKAYRYQIKMYSNKTHSTNEKSQEGKLQCLTVDKETKREAKCDICGGVKNMWCNTLRVLKKVVHASYVSVSGESWPFLQFFPVEMNKKKRPNHFKCIYLVVTNTVKHSQGLKGKRRHTTRSVVNSFLTGSKLNLNLRDIPKLLCFVK